MALGTLQQRNAQSVAQLSADFRRRYEPNYAWADAASAILAMPGLRAFWPCSANYHTAADRLRDQSGCDNHLTENAGAGNPRFGFDSLAAYTWLSSASTQSYQRADGGAANWADITGSEAYILGAAQGMTIGGWFQVSSASAVQVLMAKWGFTAPLADQRSYELSTTGAGLLQFSKSRLGTAATVTTATTTGAVSAWTWFFACGRVLEGTRVYVTLNDETVTANTAGGIFDSTAPFEVGIWDNRDAGGGGGWLNGLCSMMFLSAMCLSTEAVQCLFDLTRPMYGVRL